MKITEAAASPHPLEVRTSSLRCSLTVQAKGAALTVLEPSFSTKDATGSLLVTALARGLNP